MTAFAAVVQKRDDPAAIAAVAQALVPVTGATASSLVSGRCALLVAPLHRTDAATPVARTSGVTVVGSIVLEDPGHLALTLGEPDAAGVPGLIGAAYDRWQEQCAEHLSGEYAFALWDPRQQVLVCARDGLGIRLVYIAESPEAIVVTNVLAAALRHPSIPNDLDETAMAAFLAHGGSADATRTCFRHVKVLPPGHTLTIPADGRSRGALQRHWHFPLSDGRRRTTAEILEEYRTLLAGAVRDRLDAGGTSIFLSGGIDSTTMAAAATEVAPAGALHAITTRYTRYVEDVEFPYTRAAAGHLGVPLTVLDADAHEPWSVDPADPPLTAPLDEPMLADWRDALAAAAGHGTVSLYGEDGDALLRPPGWHGLRNTGSIAAIGFAAIGYALTSRRRPYVGLRWRERIGMVRAPGQPLPDWLTAEARARLDRSNGESVLGHALDPLPPHPTRREAQNVLTSTTISRNFAATIAPENTHRRVELRFPLLDTRLIRLVVSVPPIPWCQHKTLPRRAYRHRLPATILKRPKTPLSGFNEAYVAEWRRRQCGRLTTPAGPIDAWVDLRKWAGAIETGAPAAVMAAWRVGVLDGWLAARSLGTERACTR
jgi:asparagine synthase (glutamine-hydrolysing)